MFNYECIKREAAAWLCAAQRCSERSFAAVFILRFINSHKYN